MDKKNSIEEIIEQAYKLFSKYTIGKKLSICSPHCITKEEEKELVNTELRDVSRDLLDQSYYQSARNFSDRELYEMKHFLPRVLEMLNNFEYPAHSLEITLDRLDFDQKEKWEDEEIELLNNFSVAYFDKCLKLEILPFGCSESIGDVLVMFGSAHFNLNQILTLWQNHKAVNSLLHLKDFIFYDIKYIHFTPLKNQNAFTNKKTTKTIIEWLKNQKVKSVFAIKLEDVILNENSLDENTLSQLSYIYELMIN